jgi:hypothetical protein
VATSVRPKQRPIQRDWASKTLAGGLLGLSLALGCSALFAGLARGLALPVRAQLAMWMVVPIWFCVLSSSYLFENGKRAWLWLGAANIVVVGFVAAARML